MAFTIKDNTVSAVNQVDKSESAYLLGAETQPRKLLILGNSVTRHGRCPEIGWENDWGMAASGREKDYVHLLYAKLADRYCVWVKQASFWERNYTVPTVLTDEFSREREFAADTIVWNLGENVADVTDDASQAVFLEKMLAMMDFFTSPRTRFILTTCIWANPRVDAAVRQAAKTRSVPLVDLNGIGADEANLSIGRFWHSGVAGHPGDLGMARIADLLYDEINRTEQKGIKMTKTVFEKFPLGTWGHFPYDIDGVSMTEEAVRDMAACGFTLMHSPSLTAATPAEWTLQALDLCEKYGIRMILRDFSLHWRVFQQKGADEYRRIVRTEYEKYGHHHATAGFFIGDEPDERDMETCGEAYKIAMEECPGMILHVNQNPGYAEKCRRFVAESGCNLLSFDHYNQMSPDPNGVADFINDMAECAALAKEMDIPLLAVMLSVGHFRYRVPNEDDLRWQMGVALACGAKGIFWYNYYNDIRDSNYRGAPVTEFGDKTVSYVAMQTVHKRFLRDYAEIFNHCTHKGVTWLNKEYAKLPAFDGNGVLEQSFNVCAAYSDDRQTPALIAFLEGTDQFAGRKYVMVMNNTTNANAKFYLVCPPDKKAYRAFSDGNFDFEADHNDASYNKRDDGIECGFYLAPGQFELFCFE